VFINKSLICCGDNPGFASSNNAHVPAACGVAIEVPDALV
jgi:hypothetical protein